MTGLEGLLHQNDSSWLASRAMETIGILTSNAVEAGRPHVVYKPRVYRDGNAWCCALGDNPVEDVFAFGDTPQKACYAFDEIWVKGDNPKPKENP